MLSVSAVAWSVVLLAYRNSSRIPSTLSHQYYPEEGQRYLHIVDVAETARFRFLCVM